MSMAESRDPSDWNARDEDDIPATPFGRPFREAGLSGDEPFGRDPFGPGDDAGRETDAFTALSRGSLEARDILSRTPRAASNARDSEAGRSRAMQERENPEAEIHARILNEGRGDSRADDNGRNRFQNEFARPAMESRPTVDDSEFARPLRENAMALSESRALSPMDDDRDSANGDDYPEEDYSGLEGAPVLEALEDAQESVANAVRIAVTELRDISTSRARLERRLGESERIRMELQRQLEATDMVLRRSEERLADAERDARERHAELEDMRYRTAQSEARAATADRIIEDAERTAQAKLEDAEARIEALSQSLREEARRNLDAAEQDANLRVEAARSEAERQLEAARTGAEARAEYAEAEASRYRERAEAAERAAEEGSGMVQQLQNEVERLREENHKLKAWRAKATEKLKSLGLIK